MKVKAWLATEETLRRIFNNADECFDEIEGAEKLRDIRRAELASIKQETDEAQDERTRVQAALSEDQARYGQEQEKMRDEASRAQAKLRDLNAKIKEAEARNANLLEGFRALKDRLGTE
jgi:chromosome segregation ATPase